MVFDVRNASRNAAEESELDRLVELASSRLCHDLANPIGAIANGVELLQMAGAEPGGPELALVAEAVAHAAARLKFMRIAFGAAGAGQTVGRGEAELILADSYGGGRLGVVWAVAGDRPRAEVQIAFLLLQCLETAMPRGGEVRVALAGERWRIEARGERMKEIPGLWALLGGGARPEGLKPAEVQFALAPRAAARLGRRIAVEPGAETVTLGF